MKYNIIIEYDDECPFCNGYLYMTLVDGSTELCPRCNAILFGETIKQIKLKK